MRFLEKVQKSLSRERRVVFQSSLNSSSDEFTGALGDQHRITSHSLLLSFWLFR
jgi:hypothetical protein